MARPTGESARDKLNLYLALVPFIVKRGTVSVDEAAEHFGVRASTVRDAISRIACAGAWNEARMNHSTELFQIDWDDYNEDDVITLTVAEAVLEPAPFSERQRAFFLAGLEILGVHPMYRRLPEFATLVDKLRGGKSSAVSNLFGAEIDPANETAMRIQDAIDRGRRLRFTYTNNSGERGSRDVDPYRLDIDAQHWYLKGYCFTRAAMRTFALDSIEDLEILDVEIEERQIDPLTLAAGLFAESENDVHVEFELDPRALPLIASFRRPGDKPVDTGGVTRIEIPFSVRDTAIRLASSLPGTVRLTEPLDVRADVAARARAALDAYRASE